MSYFLLIERDGLVDEVAVTKHTESHKAETVQNIVPSETAQAAKPMILSHTPESLNGDRYGAMRTPWRWTLLMSSLLCAAIHALLLGLQGAMIGASLLFRRGTGPDAGKVRIRWTCVSARRARQHLPREYTNTDPYLELWTGPLR
jgi:hypothetical protein